MIEISIFKGVFDILKLIFEIYLPRQQGGFEFYSLIFGAFYL